MKTIYHNRLPHLAPLGATFFVTFRLADSLPQNIVKALKEELEIESKRLKKEFPVDYERRIRDACKRNFGKYDHQLDKKPYGACYLRLPEVAEIVAAKLQQYDGTHYDLQVYTIMPNHVHVQFSMAPQLGEMPESWPDEAPTHYVQLNEIMQLIKGGSAYSINKLLGRSGKLWFKDSYDHFVRNDKEWLNITRYILQNPVKAGFIDTWSLWPYSYCKEELVREIMI
ncbi:MAG: hypothetical protein JNK77_21125 [Saprospiraceae bacterium]|nr:hypothetical protein [Saprospiraceae bacterium]